jgi:hypothetical protein
MSIVNGVVQIFLIITVIGFLIFFTVKFILGLRDKKEPFHGKLRKYIKNILDVLWGAG